MTMAPMNPMTVTPPGGVTDGSDPSTPRAEVLQHAASRLLCRHLMEGTSAMHLWAAIYLPQYAAEPAADYRRRATMTELYNGFARTVLAASGLAFALDPILSEDADDDIRHQWTTSWDGRGTAAVAFLRHAFEDSLPVSGGLFVVEFPQVDVARPGGVTRADRRREQLYPYWCYHRVEDVLSWRVGVQNGRTWLRQLVLRSWTDDDVGLFGTRRTEIYREFYRTDAGEVGERRWQRDERAGGWRLTATVPYIGVSQIPVVPITLVSSRTPFDYAPALRDLAWVNLGHYRVHADRRWTMHLSCFPTIVREGYEPGPTQQRNDLIVGPGCIIDVPIGARAYYIEPAGVGLDHTERELRQLEQRMATLGMSFLAADTRAAETAEAKRIDANAQSATLATAVAGFEAACNAALAIHAEYLGIDTPPTVTMNRDYSADRLDPGTIAVLYEMVKNADLDRATLWRILTEWELLPKDFDPEAETATLQAVAAARLEAAALETTRQRADAA